MQARRSIVALIPFLLLFGACNRKSGNTAEICGCKDATALNNDANATKSDPKQCLYAIDSVTGVYDIIDTFISFSSRGPDTTFDQTTLTVTRLNSSELLFDKILICDKCTDGGISYSKPSHGFYYTSNVGPYTDKHGEGSFSGNTIRYKQEIWDQFSGLTPSHRGAGVKRN